MRNTVTQIFYLVSDNDRYSYEPKGLRIKSITEDDNGQYTCRAEVEEDGRLEERVINVIVHSMFSCKLPIAGSSGVSLVIEWAGSEDLGSVLLV